MNRRVPLVSAILILICLTGPTSFSQTMTTYFDKEHNIQFDVPEHWETKTGFEEKIPYLESTSPDNTVALYVFVYKDASISTRELLDQSIKELGFKVNADIQKEMINGLDAFTAVGTGRVHGNPVGMEIMAATYDENNYVAYVFTDPDRFDKNAKMMDAIIDSFRPINK